MKGSKDPTRHTLAVTKIVDRVDKEVLSLEFKISGVNNNNSKKGKKPSEQGAHINLKVKGQVRSFVR